MSSQPNTAGESLYRVTTALTYSLKTALISGILKNYVHVVGASILVPRDAECWRTYVIMVLATEVDGVHVYPECTFFRFRRDLIKRNMGHTLRNRPSCSPREAKA